MIMLVVILIWWFEKYFEDCQTKSIPFVLQAWISYRWYIYTDTAKAFPCANHQIYGL